MDRQELAADMRQQFKSSFLNQTQVGEYFGWKAEKVRKAFAGVECIRAGKEKKFHVLDLAKKMEESKAYSLYGA